MKNQKPGNGNCSFGPDRVQGNQLPRLERKGGGCGCGGGRPK